jgi:hypothetical protein
MTITKSIKRLERRLQHLTERIAAGKKSGKNLSFDKSERAALKRAIQIMEDYLLNEPDDDERPGPCLGEQVFGEYWPNDIALTEEERDMLSR